jgi:hypothetical protein
VKLFLSDEEATTLRRVANQNGISQQQFLRAAIVEGTKHRAPQARLPYDEERITAEELLLMPTDSSSH